MIVGLYGVGVVEVVAAAFVVVVRDSHHRGHRHFPRCPSMTQQSVHYKKTSFPMILSSR